MAAALPTLAVAGTVFVAGMLAGFKVGREWARQDVEEHRRAMLCSDFCSERGFSVSRVAEVEWKGVGSCFCREPKSGNFGQ